IELVDLAYEYFVVSAIAVSVRPAFEISDCAGHGWRAVVGGAYVQAGPFICASFCEPIGQFCLRFAQYGDAERIRRLPLSKARRVSQKAEEDQGRVERHGVERTDCRPQAVAVNRSGDDSYPGRKLSKSVAKRSLVYCHGVP